MKAKDDLTALVARQAMVRVKTAGPPTTGTIVGTSQLPMAIVQLPDGGTVTVPADQVTEVVYPPEPRAPDLIVLVRLHEAKAAGGPAWLAFQRTGDDGRWYSTGSDIGATWPEVCDLDRCGQPFLINPHLLAHDAPLPVQLAGGFGIARAETRDGTEYKWVGPGGATEYLSVEVTAAALSRVLHDVMRVRGKLG